MTFKNIQIKLIFKMEQSFKIASYHKDGATEKVLQIAS